jgi:hypothetical protein
MVLKTGNFLGPMDQAQRRTKRTTTQMAAEFEKVANRVGALGVAAATAAAGGIAALTREGMNAIDSQAKLARSLEGTIDGLRAVNIAASDSGIDGMEASLNRMNRRLGAVEMSGGPALKTVQRLNLDLAALRDMDVDERVAHIADRIHDMGLSNQEAARHLQQLGFEQRAATQLFMDGGAAIRAARQEVDEYGLSVSMVDAAAIEAANDALSRSGRLVESTRNGLAVELAPIVLEVANHFNDAARSVGGMQSAVQSGVDTSLLYLGRFLDAVWDIDRMIQVAGVTTREFSLTVVRSMAEAATAIVEGPINRLNGLIELMNSLPGVDIGFVDQPDIAFAMREQVGELEAAIRRAQAELVELESGTRPSERLQAFIAQAREAAAALGGDGGENLFGDDDRPGEGGGIAASAAASVDAIQQQVDALSRQAEMLGMAEDAAMLYALEQDGATVAQLSAARAALETIAAYEASEKAAEDYQNLLDDLRTTEERLTDQLHERLAVLDAVNVASDEYAETAARIAEAAFVDAPEYGGLDATIGGPFGELDKIDEAEEKLQEWYATQLEMLEGFREDRADLTEQWDAQERALKQEHEDELARIEQARMIAQMAGAESLFGSLSDISKQFAGEQSGIFKAMFAAEKAFAIASAIISIQQGIASAAALPFPANIPAMASVAAATAGIVSTIQSTGLAGQAHDGIMSVPEDGTWNLKKGERVTTSETSAKMDATLARVESQMNRPGESGGGGAGAAPIINIIEDKSRAGTTSQRKDNDRGWVIDVVVASITGDGKVDSAMRGKYGVQPRGR